MKLEGLGNWDKTSQPLIGNFSVWDVFEANHDYVPRQMQIHSIIVFTPRGVQGGSIYETGSAQKFHVLIDQVLPII